MREVTVREVTLGEVPVAEHASRLSRTKAGMPATIRNAEAAASTDNWA